MVANLADLPPPSISAEECRALANTVFPPTPATTSLQGRPAFIPFTKQGFVLGELQPRKDEDQKEQVQIVTRQKSKNERHTVLLDDAKKWLLQKAMSTDNNSGMPPPAKTNPVSKPPTSAKATKINSINNSNNNKKPSKEQKKAPPKATTTSNLNSNMVEIQEEYNPDGSQVTGNVVNVTSEFQALIESMGGSPMNLNAVEGEEKLEELDETLKPISEQEYGRLSQRLDELARLEELEQLKQPTKLQRFKKKSNNSGGGWNKGFLNNQSTKKKQAKKKPATEANSQQVPASATASKATAQPTASATASTPVRKNTSTKTPATSGGGGGGNVVFDMSQNQVQEIPSIPGSQPLPPRNNNGSAKTAATSNNSRMLDASVFSGLIQERPTTGTVERPIVQERQQQRQQQHQHQQQQQAKPKKKLSRFAQERMS